MEGVVESYWGPSEHGGPGTPDLVNPGPESDTEFLTHRAPQSTEEEEEGESSLELKALWPCFVFCFFSVSPC